MEQSLSDFRKTVIFLLITILGAFLFPMVPIKVESENNTEQLQLTLDWPGTPADLVEKEVVTPLEGAVELVPEIKQTTSISRYGRAEIRLVLTKNADPVSTKMELLGHIRRIFSNFPEGVSFPEIAVANNSNQQEERPILTYSLQHEKGPNEANVFAKNEIIPLLQKIAGIRTIHLEGFLEKQWNIVYDEKKMKRLGIEVVDLKNQLKFLTDKTFLGKTIVDHTTEVWLRQGGYKNWQSIPIQIKEGVYYPLNQLVDIYMEISPPTSYYRINGKEALRLLIYSEANANSINLARQINQKLDFLKRNHQGILNIHLDDDSTAYLKKELGKIYSRTGLSLSFLLLFMLLTFKGKRSVFIVLASLAGTMGVATLGYLLLGVELHFYSFTAITISVGIILDNIIVAFHHLKSLSGKQYIGSLVAATLTTLSAMMAIAFLPEDLQLSLWDFGVVLSINLIASILVVSCFLPALFRMAFWQKNWDYSVEIEAPKKNTWLKIRYEKWLATCFRYRKVFIICWVFVLGLPIMLLPEEINGWDGYNKIRGSSIYKYQVEPFLSKYLGGTLNIFIKKVPFEPVFDNKQETMLTVRAAQSLSTSIIQMDKAIREMEKFLNRYPDQVKSYVSTINSGQRATIKIFFKRGIEPTFPYQLRDKLVVLSLGLGGMEWSIFGIGEGFSNRKGFGSHQFKVSLTGFDRMELDQQCRLLGAKLLTHPRIKKVDYHVKSELGEQNGREVQFNWNPSQLAQHHLTLKSLKNLLEPFNQSPYNRYQNLQGQRVVWTNMDSPKLDLWAMESQPILMDSLRPVIGRLGKMVDQKIKENIYKENQQYIQTIAFEYEGSGRGGEAFLKNTLVEFQKELPLGYILFSKGISNGWDAFVTYKMLFVIFGVIFLVSTLFFNSLFQAFLVILALPFNFIGVFLAFYWLKIPFDSGGYASFLLTGGLAVNGMIFVLDYYNQLTRNKPGINEFKCFLEAVNRKILPILLTVISTVAGMLPFLFEGKNESFWPALATGIIGGLVFSIPVLIFLLPVLLIKRI